MNKQQKRYEDRLPATRVVIELLRGEGIEFCPEQKGKNLMETRVAVISIIVTDSGKIDQLNDLLHEYSEYILGRMGIPYREKNLNIISIAIDAPMDRINSLSGALGRLDGISAKVTYAKA